MKLNLEQKKAVELINQACIVIAGPGTGKTALISEKIYYLISKKKYLKEEVLALTFTNKAADEMSERVSEKIGTDFTAKTFHSFALNLIEEYYKKIPDLDKNYTLISDTDSLIFFIENIDNFNLQSVEIKNNINSIAYELQSSIFKLKENGISILELESMKFEDLQVKIDLFTVYSFYEKYKKKHNYIDFGDILILLKKLLIKKPDIRNEIKKKFSYILVDEFQDTNKIQLDILDLIVNTKRDNITIVGDQKQSIYSFRGANFSNLNLFKKKFENFDEIFLKDNYRSSNNILKLVNKFILDISSEKEVLNLNFNKFNNTVDNKFNNILGDKIKEVTNKENKENHKYKYKGDNPNLTSYVNLIESKDENSQIAYLIEKINEIREIDNKRVSTIGVLFRRNSEIELVSKKLNEFNIKHTSTLSNNFMQNEIVKDLIMFLKVINNQKESNIEIFHLLNYIGLRSETIRKISRKSSLQEKSIYNVLINVENISDFDNENIKIKKFVADITSLIKIKNSKTFLSDLVIDVISKFNLYSLVEGMKNDIGILSLNKFIVFTQNYVRVYKKNNLELFLKFISFSKGIDFQDFSIDENLKSDLQLMTIHNSKGKEFDYVFVLNLNERRFPLPQKKFLFEVPFNQNLKNHLEEEMRLFFVAISRAKLGLNICYVKKFSQNKVDSKKSIFLEKIISDIKLKNYFNYFFNELILPDLKLSLKEKVKLEIIHKINKFLQDDYYEDAKKEIDLLSSLFASKNSLNSFIKNSHHDYDYYKMILRGENNFSLNVDMSKQIYSVSQLKTYEQCPKKYLYQYVYKVPTIAKHYFDFGTSVHEVLEHLVEDIKIDVSKEMLYAKAINMLYKVWISKGYQNATQEREYFEKGVIAIREYIEKEIELRGDFRSRETIGKEKTFTIDVEGRKIYGIIDRVDKIGDEFEILDYKTSNSCESKTQLNKSIQLFVYAMAAKELYGKYPKRLGLWYLIHNKILSIEFSDEKLENIKKVILNLIKKIEKKNFNSIPSKFACTYCDFNKICKDSLNS